MIYDLSLQMGWLPRDVRAMPVSDLIGLAKASSRREQRSKRGR
jgi:hypothetical protein